MRTNSKEVRMAVQKYVIDSLSTQDFDGHNGTIEASIEIVWNEFKRVALYPNNLRKLTTYQNCFMDWLQGLPSCLSVGFSDYDIDNFLTSIGLPQPTNKNSLDSAVLYYYLIYREFLALAKKHKITLTY